MARVALCLLLLTHAVSAEAPAREAVQAAVAHAPTVGFSLNFSLTARRGVVIYGLQTEPGLIHTAAACDDLTAQLDGTAADGPRLLRLATLHQRGGREVEADRAARRAIELFEALGGAQADDPAVRRGLAEGLILTGEGDAAAAILRPLHAAAPGETGSLLLARALMAQLLDGLRGDLAEAVARGREAVAALVQVTERHPDWPEPYTWLTLARAGVGQLGLDDPPAILQREYLDLLWDAASRAPDDPQLMGTAMAAISVLSVQNLPERPRIAFVDLKPLLPPEIAERVATLRERCLALLASPDRQTAADAGVVAAAAAIIVDGDFVAAAAAVEPVLARSPADHPVWLLPGVALVRAERYDELAALVESKLGEFDSAWLRVVLGKCRLLSGRPDDALTEFDAASQLDPNDPLPYVGLAAARLCLGTADDLDDVPELLDFAAELGRNATVRAESLQFDLLALRSALLSLEGDADGATQALAAVPADTNHELTRLLRQARGE